MQKCVWCGRHKKVFEEFNVYGFCPECYSKVKLEIKERIKDIEDFIATYKRRFNGKSPGDAVNISDQYLSSLNALEEMRHEVPMFKSDTSYLRTSLERIRSDSWEKYCFHRRKLLTDESNAALKSAAMRNAGSFAIHKNCPLLSFPRKVDHFELAYFIRSVPLFGAHHAKPNFSHLRICDPVSLVPSSKEDDIIFVKHENKAIGNLFRERGDLEYILKDWCNDLDPIFAYISSFNENSGIIFIDIGFYFSEQDALQKFGRIETELTATHESDSFWNCSRQQNLRSLLSDDVLIATYNQSTGIYTVMDDKFREMGELNKSISSQLWLERELNYPYIVVKEVQEDTRRNISVVLEVYVKQRKRLETNFKFPY